MNVDRFPQLPFVTEPELRELFGSEVGQALDLLKGINDEHEICSSCGGECCRQMGCEFFDHAFEECPVHEYRPVLCRFHYCEKFGDDHESLIRELLDIFVSGVSQLEDESGSIPSIELNMLLYSACRKPGEPYPQLVDDVRDMVAAFRGGEVGGDEAVAMLRGEVLSYRSRNMEG